MNHFENSAILIAISAIITLSLRAIPFAIFNGKREMAPNLKKIVDMLPPAIMSVLVIYCIKTDIIGLKSLILLQSTENIASIIATAVALIGVVLIHLWKRKTLFSIATGTVLYMILIRIIS